MRLFFLFIFFTLHLDCLRLIAVHPDQSGNEINLLHDWNSSMLLKDTERKTARTAILIIAPPKNGDSFVEKRWKIGKKVWEQYMNSHPNVDCYFIQTTYRRSDAENLDQAWLEGNTIYVGDWWYDKHESDRILHKTIVAMEYLFPKYTHFIRTNLNVFFNLKNVNEYMETHHQSFYTTPLWESSWYTIGYSIMYTADVAAHIASEYRRMEKMEEELIAPHHADDAALTSLATGVWPYDKKHPFRCCSALPFGIRQLMCKKAFSTERLNQYGALLTPPISLEQAITYCKQAPNNVMLYRTNGDLNLNEIARLYEYLLNRIYPELPHFDVVEYGKSLQK